MSEKNPYMAASHAYGSAASGGTDSRMLEGTILLKSAQALETLATRLRAGEAVHFTEVGEVLERNQKLWVLFVEDAVNPDHPLPQDIKNNIASLAMFIFNRTKDVLIAPSADKLQILININRNIAGGLMKRPVTTDATPKTETAAREVADSFA